MQTHTNMHTHTYKHTHSDKKASLGKWWENTSRTLIRQDLVENQRENFIAKDGRGYSEATVLLKLLSSGTVEVLALQDTMSRSKAFTRHRPMKERDGDLCSLVASGARAGDNTTPATAATAYRPPTSFLRLLTTILRITAGTLVQKYHLTVEFRVELYLIIVELIAFRIPIFGVALVGVLPGDTLSHGGPDVVKGSVSTIVKGAEAERFEEIYCEGYMRTSAGSGKTLSLCCANTILLMTDTEDIRFHHDVLALETWNDIKRKRIIARCLPKSRWLPEKSLEILTQGYYSEERSSRPRRKRIAFNFLGMPFTSLAKYWTKRIGEFGRSARAPHSNVRSLVDDFSELALCVADNRP
ncbi:hypothetical protein EVAR_13250_1 [Eumeta japonica]|uniref:Uncharacterized protein n=1 Tax=Eumeta variegata TaxID=151549 RepID=A0A4C1TS88_EUMVA|nr:hypothetical protein EVAR_13250_1 [Eumeta japonica]